MEYSLTAVAVDDEPKALEIIQLHSDKVVFLDLRECFRDPLDAIHHLQSHPVDLLFLDINMPHLSGLRFREMLGKGPMIIFTTAYSEFAVESYELQALDYLLKPVSFDRFLKAVLKAREHHAIRTHASPPPAPMNQQQLYFKSGSKLYKFASEEILYFEKDGNYIVVHTADKKVLSRLNMSQLLEILPAKEFLRVHKSYVINLRHISIIEPHQVTLGSQRIPVAKSYREALRGSLGE